MARVHRILDQDITSTGVITLTTPLNLQQLYDQTGFFVLRFGEDLLGSGTAGIPTAFTVRPLGSIQGLPALPLDGGISLGDIKEVTTSGITRSTRTDSGPPEIMAVLTNQVVLMPRIVAVDVSSLTLQAGTNTTRMTLWVVE